MLSTSEPRGVEEVVVEGLLLRPLASAFLEVGVPVALLAAGVAWARVRWGTRVLDVLVRHRGLAPLLAALIGVVPGCGGAILVAALYLKGRASYGAAVAALTATMGDASFVMIAIDPQLALYVHALLLVVGALSGYAVDAVGFDPRGRARDRDEVRAEVRAPVALAAAAPVATPLVGPVAPGSAAPPPDPVSGGASRPPEPQPWMRRRPVLLGLAPATAALWLTALIGLTLFVPASLTLIDPDAMTPLLGGIDLWLLVGVTGALACLVVFVAAGCRICDDGDDVPADLPTALTHGAVETAFVTVWVAAAFVLLELVAAVAPPATDVLLLTGVVGVLVAVGVALIPGCGPQIAFTGLYATGALPLPTLLANAVAQDGDALLPLLALDRRAAVITSLLTSVPAVLVGLSALAIL